MKNDMRPNEKQSKKKYIYLCIYKQNVMDKEKYPSPLVFYFDYQRSHK